MSGKENSLGDFEAAMQQLEDILEKMADDALPLEESIRLYARAAELIAQSNQTLEAAKVRVQEIDDSIARMKES